MLLLDDISKSQVSIVDFTDNNSPFDSQFPSTESISNNIIVYDNETDDFDDDEFIRNYKLSYGSNSSEFAANEDIKVRKLTFTDRQGSGFLNDGHVIRTLDTKAEVIGYSQANQIIYLGKIGRCKSTGEDYFDITFNGDAQLRYCSENSLVYLHCF